MLTGDSQTVANAVARELGIDTVFAEGSPSTRPRRSTRSRRAGSSWRWWGDDVNDAPALVSAGRHASQPVG